MANKPVSIEFIADVAKYLREVKKMDVATEDVADALVATTNSADDLERKLSKAMKDSAKDTEVLERALKDVGDAADHMGDEAKRGFDKIDDDAKEAGKEAGSSFVGSLGEGLASGDTSEVFNEVLGEMVQNVSGPASAAVGVGAAVALAVWNTFKAQSEKFKQGVADSFNLFDEVTGQLDKIGQLQKSLEELGGGNFQTGIQDAHKYAELLGLDFQDVADVITGEVNPHNDATLEIMRQQRTVLEEQRKKAGGLGGIYADQMDALEEILGTRKDENAEMEQSIQNQRDWKSVQDQQLMDLPQVSRFYEIMASESGTVAANMGLWKTHADEARAALEAMPDNLDIRLRVDSSALRQLFPYGTSSQADVDKIVSGFNPYGTKAGSKP